MVSSAGLSWGIKLLGLSLCLYLLPVASQGKIVQPGSHSTGQRAIRDQEQISLGFEPFGSLDALSSSDFTTLGHPAFPRYSVRIKKSNFCDGTVE
jgi:hypothetical protein